MVWSIAPSLEYMAEYKNSLFHKHTWKEKIHFRWEGYDQIWDAGACIFIWWRAGSCWAEPPISPSWQFCKIKLLPPIFILLGLRPALVGQFHKTWIGADFLFDRSSSSTNRLKQENNQTCLRCFETCFSCLLVFQTSPFRSRRGGGRPMTVYRRPQESPSPI